MTKLILGILIFCIVLFIYLHVMFHLKTSDDLEIYEIDDTSKEKIEEIFDLRQPVLFYYGNDKIIEATNKKTLANHYGSFDIKIRNIHETDEDNDLHVPLSMNVANKLFDEDKKGSYFSENNHEFLEESGIKKSFKFNDVFLRPAMVSNCYYDILLGSKNVFTPFRYEINYRNFFLVTQGSIHVKISPPYCTKHLYVNYDYENFEFSSPVNPWLPQSKYKADFERVKCVEFVLTPGKMCFLPAYWWYSIKFLDSDTSVSCFRYRTYMNNLAISPYICLHLLQLQNIKRTSVKTINLNEKQNLDQNEKHVLTQKLDQPINREETNTHNNDNNNNNDNNDNNDNDDDCIDNNRKKSTTDIIEISTTNIDDLVNTISDATTPVPNEIIQLT